MNLLINDKKYSYNASNDMPLLWVLRDILGLTGTKYGCGKGLCGSCSVLVDGDSVRSCNLPVSAVQGKSITTIEGLSNKNKNLQDAWNEVNVPQCGFCQPGQLISAAALLNKNPNPDDEDISNAMSGNICRCGTYVRIKKAIHQASKNQSHE